MYHEQIDAFVLSQQLPVFKVLCLFCNEVKNKIAEHANLLITSRLPENYFNYNIALLKCTVSLICKYNISCNLDDSLINPLVKK